MEPYEILEKAADLIEERGHCKRKFTDDRGHFCALGAINYAVHERPDKASWSYAAALAKTALMHEIDGTTGTFDIAKWNDDPKRKKAQVVRTLRKAAERAKKYYG